MGIRYSADTFLAISEKWREILSAKADIEEIRTNLIHHINHRQFES